ncbi:serine hydrolase domain-containing protein [Peribacillus kribbensis]|uniref:serine hydrolase domain-containing protein n=1 Tax=Peribacillus kribbensis TaxID=356658 RepID=UPI00040F8551|nr:serine hydrolase domain-containing protein [Peribacillus kribbensis]
MFEQLVQWVEEIKEKNHSSAAALLIIKDGKTVLEHYSGNHSNTKESNPVNPHSLFNVASARKSYLGLAAAYALFEGKIKSLDDPAGDYFPEMDQNVLGCTTIRHLVTHSHGLNEKEDGTVYREFQPGEGWAYRGINVLMVTKLIKKLYGVPFTKLLQDRVFTPLGFSETGWFTEPLPQLVKVIIHPEEQGMDKIGMTQDGTESNLFVSAREFARWGELHLNRGFLDGKQIVPSGVIDIAVNIQSPSYKNKELPKNGLFWYVQNEISAAKSEIGGRVPEGSYQILGITGPALLIIPRYHAVIVKMFNKRYNYGGENYLYYLREFGSLAADALSYN